MISQEEYRLQQALINANLQVDELKTNIIPCPECGRFDNTHLASCSTKRRIWKHRKEEHKQKLRQFICSLGVEEIQMIREILEEE
jgi:4-hydroxy-3-methylbut-2-en-1-yl diphosphate synthase IspG/GcpE